MFLIGITGISCSGKTTFSKMLQNELEKYGSLLISMDDYYKELTKEQYDELYNENSSINFDVPEAVDLDLLYQNLSDLKNGVSIKMPKFDLGSCVITNYLDIPANKYKYVIVEGVMLFCHPKIVDLCDLKIFIEQSDAVCAMRRMQKYTEDIKGYTIQYTLNQMSNFVIPGQDKYIKPSRNVCDIYVNGNKLELHLKMILRYILDFA